MDQMVTCVDCNETKPVSEFYKRSGQRGYRLQCKSCIKVQGAKRYRADPARHNAVVNARYRSHGRYARYGLTQESFEALLAQQGHACKLCGTKKPGGKGEWHVDHVRGEGEPRRRKTWKPYPGMRVRGILCHRCNVALGHFEAFAERLGIPAVLEYINAPPHSHPAA